MPRFRCPTRLFPRSLRRALDWVSTPSASGGARMQEGVLSLMQMAKASALLSQLGERRIPYVSILTNPTMGGVAAILPNLAGREHLVAISLGIVTYFLLDRWWPAWRRRRIERATAD